MRRERIGKKYVWEIKNKNKQKAQTIFSALCNRAKTYLQDTPLFPTPTHPCNMALCHQSASLSEPSGIPVPGSCGFPKDSAYYTRLRNSLTHEH